MKVKLEKHRPDTVNMLLNPKMYSGKSEGRTGPLLAALALIFLPLFFSFNIILNLIMIYGLLKVLALIIPLYLIYIWKVTAKILLREKERVERFKREKIEKYVSVDDITNISKIYKDGCIEYINGDISYFIICKNGNKADPIYRATEIEKFFTSISRFKFNIHILNQADSSTLSSRYSNIAIFKDKSIARDMLEIIDYNKRIVEDNSLITLTVFEIKGRISDKVNIKKVLENGVRILNNKVYRLAVIADDEAAAFLLNRTLMTDINFNDIFLRRFSKGEYYQNKILGYDIDYITKKNNKEKIIKEEFEWMEKF